MKALYNNKLYCNTKSLISLRLDTDVIEFFKKQGPGYQGRMNSILRFVMLEQMGILKLQPELPGEVGDVIPKKTGVMELAAADQEAKHNKN